MRHLEAAAPPADLETRHIQVTLAESRLRYVSPDLEFAVWAATIGESPEGEPVTLASPLGHVTAGEQLVCSGAFSRHPRYVVAGARTRSWLTQAEAWLLENQRLFAAVSLLVFGAVLAADGIVRLL